MAEVNVRKRGKTWEYRFEAAPINGKRQQPCKGGFKTKKSALEAGNKALAKYNQSGLHFTPSDTSYSDYLDYWMDEYVSGLSADTYRNYEKKIRIHIKPVLGQYRLVALTPAVLQSFLRKKLLDGYSTNSVAVMKGIISGSLSYAVLPLEFIEHNPSLNVKLPKINLDVKNHANENTSNSDFRKKGEKKREVVPTEQWNAIIERFPYGSSCHLPLQIAYRCGLRLGEIFALTWDDIDFKNMTMDINKQVQDYDHFWTFIPPKYNSNRTIKIDNHLCRLLKKIRSQQLKSKLYYGEHYQQIYIDEQNRLHFNEPKSGKLVELLNVREDGSYISSRSTQHCSSVIHHQLGFQKFDFHSLRHTHATELAESGAFPKDVQYRLGHKHIKVTLGLYVHHTDTMQDATIKILNQKPI